MGARVRKRYDTAQTPYRRVLASGVLPPAARARLDQEHAPLGPMAVWGEVEAARAALWRLPSRQTPYQQPAEAGGSWTAAPTVRACLLTHRPTTTPAPRPGPG